MADGREPRRPGRPSIWGASTKLAYLDRMGAGVILAINEDAVGTPEKRAADAANLRGQVLRAVRKRRYLKPIEASLSRADRLNQLQKLLFAMRSDLSAVALARVLKGRGFFLDVQLGTLRKDIRGIQKARS